MKSETALDMIGNTNFEENEVLTKTGECRPKLSRGECDKVYLDETGRPFLLRFKERGESKITTNSLYGGYLVGHKFIDLSEN